MIQFFNGIGRTSVTIYYKFLSFVEMGKQYPHHVQNKCLLITWESNKLLAIFRDNK